MKEKVRIEQEEDNGHNKEIICIIIMIISYIILAEIGSVGLIIKLIFKFLFGDFYYVIILGVVFECILTVLKKPIKFTKITTSGIFIFLTTFMCLSHLAIDKNFNYKSSIVNTFRMYAYYSKNYDPNYLYGGGMFASILNNIFLFIFNKNGTIFVLIICFLLSIFLIFNMSVSNFIDAYNKISIKISKVYQLFSSLIKKIPYKVINSPNTSKISYLKEYKKESKIINEQYMYDMSINIETFLKKLDYQSNITKKSLGYRYFFLYIEFNKELDNESIIKLNHFLNDEAYILKHGTNISVYILNNSVSYLGLKSLFLENKNKIPLGMFYDASILMYNEQNILFISEDNQSFLANMIASIILIKKIVPTFFDLKKNMSCLSGRFVNYKTIIDIKGILNELEQEEELEEEKYYIINSLDEIYNQNHFEDLQYLLRFSKNIKMHFIIVNTSFIKEYAKIYSLINLKVISRVKDYHTSNLLLRNKNATILDPYSAVVIKEGKLSFIELPYISLSEYKKIVR